MINAGIILRHCAHHGRGPAAANNTLSNVGVAARATHLITTTADTITDRSTASRGHGDPSQPLFDSSGQISLINRGHSGSKAVDFDHSFGEDLGSFLGQVMSDATGDGPVRAFAREFCCIGAGLRVGCTVGIAFTGDRGHRNDRLPASRCSRSSYCGSPAARPSRQR